MDWREERSYKRLVLSTWNKILDNIQKIIYISKRKFNG
jgi:hypothetical protein